VAPPHVVTSSKVSKLEPGGEKLSSNPSPTSLEKGKPVVRPGRKTKGPTCSATSVQGSRLPKGVWSFPSRPQGGLRHPGKRLRRCAVSGFRLQRSFTMSLTAKMKRFLVSEDGPTAVEYAVMLALIVVVCLVAIQALGTNTSTTFTNIGNSLGS
jgi:pilus assembly protein Flp/PilA